MEQAAPRGISGSRAGGPAQRAAGGARPAAAPSAAGRAGAPGRAGRARARRRRGGAARRGPDSIETGQVRPDTPRDPGTGGTAPGLAPGRAAATFAAREPDRAGGQSEPGPWLRAGGPSALLKR
jgi:hypothetical protein